MQYLRRMRLQNRRFGDDVRFEGLLATIAGMRLIISQPHIRGVAPDLVTMDRCLTEQLGWRRLEIPPMGYYHSLGYLRYRTGLFDAHPANFRIVEGGILVPIDVILVPFSAADAAVLRARAV